MKGVVPIPTFLRSRGGIGQPAVRLRWLWVVLGRISGVKAFAIRSVAERLAVCLRLVPVVNAARTFCVVARDVSTEGTADFGVTLAIGLGGGSGDGST